MKKLSKTKKIIMIICFIAIIAGLANMAYLIISPYYRPVYSGIVWENNAVSEEEKLLYDFVNNKLSGEDKGIYTNYIDAESEGDITKGHSVLSESEGMILLYNLERNNQSEFDLNLKYINENMIMENNLLSWRIDHGKQNSTSSAIDDLRVVKALLLADEKWDNKEYRKLALKIAGGIRKELLDNYRISNLNDGYNKSDFTDLCYLDISALRMLSNIDYRRWKKVYDRSVDIIEGGYISDEMPLYYKQYNNKEQTYSNNDNSDNIDTLLSMIVTLNKVDDARDVSVTMNYIKDKFKRDGKVYALYSQETKEAATDIESTAIYSIIAVIASKTGDYELETMAMNRLKEFQVKNPNSVIYGGFGDEDGNNVHSYNILNALIAFSRYQ